MVQEPKSGAPVGSLGPIVRELVKTVNRLEAMLNNIRLSPEGAGKIIPAEGNIVIQLNTTDDCPS